MKNARGEFEESLIKNIEEDLSELKEVSEKQNFDDIA